jgi:hypothetical protein
MAPAPSEKLLRREPCQTPPKFRPESGPSTTILGVFDLRKKVDEIWLSMDIGIWIFMLSVWLDG